MKKSKYIIVSLLSAMALTSCSLFKDDDIVVENHFNTKGQVEEQKEAEATINGVESTTVNDVPNTLVFKNIVYSNLEGNKIKNTYIEDAPYSFKYNVNGGENYDVDKNNNNFDLYVPKSADKTKDQNVVLFIHGGAWISGLKTHVNPYVKEFANNGYIAATIEYTLLSQDMNDSSLSIFRDLDEIDACLSTMRESLIELGYNEDNLHLVLGGASSGAHLALLYAYSRDAVNRKCPFKDIKFLIDAVGPTEINENAWKAFKYDTVDQYNDFLDEGIRLDTIDYRSSHDELQDLQVAGQTYYWNEYQTMRIANGMCGLPFSLSEVEDAARNEETEADHDSPVYKSIVGPILGQTSGEEYLSVTHYMTDENKIPMICAYAGQDAVVGVAQFAGLEAILETFGPEYEYEFFYFKNCGHVNLDSDTDTYNAFMAKILNWMATK